MAHSLSPQNDARPGTRWRNAYRSGAPLVRASFWLHGGGLLWLLLSPTAWPWVLTLVLVNHAVLTLGVMIPRGRLLGPNLVRLPAAARRRGEVALTFDDGPDPHITPRILDLLDRHGAKASFFCIGERAAAHPDILRDIIRRGHSLENHTQRHPHAFACFTPAMLQREIDAAQVAIGAAGGMRPLFFRAPMGFRSPFLHAVLSHAGLRYIAWTRRGYDSVHGDVEAVSRRLLTGLRAGDVLLLHDGASASTADGQPVVLAVLPRLLEGLAAQRLRAVSLRAAFDER